MGNQFQLSFPGMPEPQGKTPRPAQSTDRQWSGPIPGQTVMHPQNLGKQNHGITSHEWEQGEDATSTEKRFLSADPHGFVQQTTSNLHPDSDASVARLYESHGGAIHTPDNHKFWSQQPVRTVSADTPLHSTQSHSMTEESGGVDSIAKDLRAGRSIKDPVWLVRDKGRLFVLDGHHRVAAARQAGRKNFPARVWDRDRSMGE